MNRFFIPFFLLTFFTGLFWQCASEQKGPRVLVFKKQEFYFHKNTDAAVEAIEALGAKNGFAVDVTEYGEDFTEENLKKYGAVVFLNTAGDVLNFTQEKQFQRYIQAGGGFVGIHTASDTEHNWPWYGQLVGGRFDSQTEPQTATIRVVDRQHPATQHLDAAWQRHDEWFNLKSISPTVHVLLTLDESTMQGGTMGAYHPLAWHHTFDGGRAFYTALGHTAETYQEPAFLQHLLGGIQYAMGDGTPLDYSKCRDDDATAASGGSEFIKTSVVCNLYEPMEFDFFPDGKILFIERRGAIKLYDPASGETRQVGELEAFLENEEGLLGLAIDPQWEKNRWIYIYYSPKEGTALRLSRFVFDQGALQTASETVLLTVPSERDYHNYHAGGGLEFDAEGYLYLAVGDNTDHYNDGYASTDEGPGNKRYDSQKSAANSMDLRGKILRIKPLPDGSYICPAGNLFTTRDVLVTPGARGLLEDPLLADALRPALRGRYQAEAPVPLTPNRPGFFPPYASTGPARLGEGCPEIFVMGCRNPFRITFDDRRDVLFWGEPGPDAGFTDSLRGPEGYDEVNAARTAGFYGWPYCVGNNSAYREYNFQTKQSGPYFNLNRPTNDSPNNTGSYYLPPAQAPIIWYPFRSTPEFPLVQNGTRCAMAGPVYYADRYPAETRLPARFDGKLLIYEWMRCWMMAVSVDSLGRYTGMIPFADSLRVSRPMDIKIDKNGSVWVLEYGTEWYAANPDACLSRIDYAPEKAKALAVKTAATAKPALQWRLGERNRSFYQPGEQVHYQLVADNAGGGAVDIAIAALDANASLTQLKKDYRPEQKKDDLARGQTLIDGSDCKACHDVARAVNGPSYLDIAQRYKDDKNAVRTLAKKIIQGGSGVWGNDRMMSAHPQIPEKDAQEMVRWIMAQKAAAPAGPLEGDYTLTPQGKAGAFVFHAAQGSGVREMLVLRPGTLQAEHADILSPGVRLNGTAVAVSKHNSHFAFSQLDLFRVYSIILGARGAGAGGRIELHLDAPDGPLAGAADAPAGATEVTLPVDLSLFAVNAPLRDLYFVFKNENAGGKPILTVDWVRFNVQFD